jgi:hypothetical protein
VTSGICELIVGNMDIDFSKGVVVGHACGEVDVDIFVFLLPSSSLLLILDIVVQGFLVL